MKKVKETAAYLPIAAVLRKDPLVLIMAEGLHSLLIFLSGRPFYQISLIA